MDEERRVDGLRRSKDTLVWFCNLRAGDRQLQRWLVVLSGGDAALLVCGLKRVLISRTNGFDGKRQRSNGNAASVAVCAAKAIRQHRVLTCHSGRVTQSS